MRIRFLLLVFALPAPAVAQLVWEQQFPTVSPSPRVAHSMAYDSLRGVTVLFGGAVAINAAAALDDTWEWDGAEWSQRVVQPSPPAMLGQSLAYDPVRGVMVLAGGNPFETWEWDGSNWIERFPPVSPPATTWQFTQLLPPNFMVFDSWRGVIVRISNSSAGGALQTTLWEWDGTQWMERTVAGLPSLVLGAAFDSLRGVMVAAGLSAGSVTILEWDGTSLSASSPAMSVPPPFAGAVFDPVLQVALFDSCEAVMGWDGLSWVAYPAVGGAGCRSSSPLVFDPLRAAAVRFGGWYTGGPVYADTWTRSSSAGVFLTAAATTYGNACGSPAPSFAPEAGSRPIVGTTFTSEVVNASLGIAFVAWGLSNVQWGGNPLPVSLAPIGLEGCLLWQSGELRLDDPCMPTGLTTARHSFVVPLQHSLVGARVYGQAWTIQPLFNSLGVVLSNGLELTIGNL